MVGALLLAAAATDIIILSSTRVRSLFQAKLPGRRERRPGLNYRISQHASLLEELED